MLKKCFLPVCLLLALLLCIPAGAVTSDLTVYTNGTLRFASFTEGAERAFDGDPSTAFEGSVTGMFSGRSVLTGLTIRAGSKIRNLVVSGSEDGVHWVKLYSRERVNSACIFGYNGVNFDDSALNEMYTYALRYLRVEMEYGSIAELEIRGYEVDVHGTVAELDADFGDGDGYESSGSYYEDHRTPYLFDHIIGSAAYGDAITYPDSQNKYAYLTVRTAQDAPLRAIALAHKTNDSNAIRWNGVRIEASQDGKAWDTLRVLPADFSVTNDLRQKTLFILTLEGENSYRYVRISSTSASISIGTLDLYVDAPAAEVPDSVLSGWEGDPYLGPNAPVETREPDSETDAPDSGTEAAGPETAEAPGSTASSESNRSGCKSRLGSTSLCALMGLCALAAVMRLKRKSRFIS